MIGGFATRLLFSVYNYSIRRSNNKLFIIWDCFTSVSSNLESEVPQKALEDGRFSTDSKIRKPQILTIDAIKSSPLTIYKDIQKLNDAVRSADLFRISTRYGNYRNYTLQNFSYTLDSKNATSLKANMIFTEVIIVQPEYQNLTAAQVKNAQNAGTVSTGKKQMKGSSVAFKLFKKAGGK